MIPFKKIINLKKNSTLIFFTCLSILFSQLSQAAVLSPLEKQIQNNAIEQQGSALALLEQLVNINSGTANFSGIYRVGEILRKQFEQLGFKTHWIEQPKKTHRMGLLAERKGPPGAKRLLLLGHLDTALNGGFQPWTRDRNLAIGSGVIDNKGGDVVMLYALKALQAMNLLENTSITVLLTVDAENVGWPVSISRKPLFQAAQHTDVVLDFEPSFGLNTATIGRRGTSYWEIKATDSSGNNKALFELARILNAIYLEWGEEKYLSFSPIFIENLSSEEQSSVKIFAVKGSLSFSKEEQPEKIEEKMQTIVQKNLPGTTATMRFQDEILAMKPTEQNKKLLKSYSQVSVDLGYGAVKPLPPALRDSADISYIAGSIPANLSGLGPVGTGTHSIKETLEIPSLFIAIQRAALLIYRLSHPIP